MKLFMNIILISGAIFFLLGFFTAPNWARLIVGGIISMGTFYLWDYMQEDSNE